MDTQSLCTLLYRYFAWHPARICLLAELIFAVIKARTVKLKDLAMHVSSKGSLKAKIVKIERLLLQQDFNYQNIGTIITKILCASGKVMIAIDRTNWQFGKKNLNFFVAAIILNNISVPIAWSTLNKKGNSNTEERKDLIEKILKILPLERIELILAGFEKRPKKCHKKHDL